MSKLTFEQKEAMIKRIEDNKDNPTLSIVGYVCIVGVFALFAFSGYVIHLILSN
jgi:hypothetical protein